ncbi:MAG: bile acid CoA ligase [Marmoricola sp.]|nr:bile acid CoA ligase [Marmoricola sp.]
MSKAGGGSTRRAPALAAVLTAQTPGASASLTAVPAPGLLNGLAGYKVPRRVVVLDDLPRNDTGKVMKRQLAE